MNLMRLLLILALGIATSSLSLAQDAGLYAVESALNVRQQRSSKSPVVKVFNKGDRFRAGYLSNNWYAVFVAEGPLPSEANAIGYAYAPIVEKFLRVSATNVAEPSPERASAPVREKSTEGKTSFWPIFFVGLFLYFLFRKKNHHPARRTHRKKPHLTFSSSVEFDFEIRHNETASAGSLVWFGEKSVLRVSGYEIHNPNTYSGPRQPVSDASYIDTSLRVAITPAEESESIGYWPQYSEITDSQRSRYLKWLASGRPKTNNFGYLFLYFYGLERRALVDKADFQLVVEEVGRLLNLHGESNSFLRYASSFLAFLAASHISDPGSQVVKTAIDLLDQHRHNGKITVVLAYHHLLARPISPELAMLIASESDGAVRSVITKRVPHEFAKLFKEKYIEKFPTGLSLVAGSGMEAVYYGSASPSLSGRDFSAEVPKVRISAKDQKSLVLLWNSSVEALKAYSKKIASGAPASREAFEALPEVLRKTSIHPDRDAWEEIVENSPEVGSVSLVTVSELASARGIKQRERLTLSESRALAKTAEALGWLFEPDARFTQRPYDWTAKVGIASASGVPEQGRSPEFQAAALILEAGVTLAGADGSVQDIELEYITKYLGEQFMLGGDDAKRLECLRHAILGASPVKLSIKKKLLESLSQTQRAALATYLVGVVASKGFIERAELKALRSSFKSLSVDESVLETLLGKAQGNDELVSVTKSSPRKSGEQLVRNVKKSEPSHVTLDDIAVARILAETTEVSKMLSDVLSSVDESGSKEAASSLAAGPESPHEGADDAKAKYSGLPTKYHSFVDQLVLREKWSRSELTDLAKSCGLMPSDAVDSVNEWADDSIGDLVIQEEGNGFSVAAMLIKARAA